MYELITQIHKRWETAGELTTLLPASRVLTGEGPLPPPFAQVIPGAQTTCVRTSEGYLDRVEFALRVVTGELSQLEAICEHTRRVYDGWRQPLAGGRILVGTWLEEAGPATPQGDFWEKVLRFVSVVFTPVD